MNNAGIAYFSRHLLITDSLGQVRIVDESELLTILRSTVVLGEPGMGKSELIRELGRQLGVEPITATRFMNATSPAKFVVSGKPLLIDGLDEAMARREGDAIDRILAQLEAAGSPDFILSCRAHEWQARNLTSFRQVYGSEPAIYTLEALSRKEASAFLSQRYAQLDPESVLGHLDRQGIAELYGNPLTLSLMGTVAVQDTTLPATRAALFQRVCVLLWPEHDSDRQDSGLGLISENRALASAGAIMAGLILSGADTVSLAAPIHLQEGEIRLADLQILPDANWAPQILSSRLFRTVGVGLAKPVHRVVAEFLGARWLASHATTPRMQRRLLAQFHGSGGVPASLRGLHAWLAFHSPMMAKAVIFADPFGVLRYGEMASLTAEQAGWMFEALEILSKDDPYFRSQDWGSHTAVGLMIPDLCSRIMDVIGTTASNFHLRTLLMEGLKGTQLAGDLADTLELVMRSVERSYTERRDAASALLPHRDRVWWRSAISELHDQCTQDSTRLARNLIEDIDCDVPVDRLVATLLAEVGATICPVPNNGKRRAHALRYYMNTGIVDVLPSDSLIKALNLFSECAGFLSCVDQFEVADLQALIASLIVRAIDEGEVLADDAEIIWGWLGIFRESRAYNRKEVVVLREKLDANDELRHAIQSFVLYDAAPRVPIASSEPELTRRMVGLRGRPADICYFLDRLATADNKDLTLRAAWCDLMYLGIDPKGLDPEVRLIGRKFQAADVKLDLYVQKLENPRKPPWQFREERRLAKQERKRRISNEWTRRHYAEKRAALRQGELKMIRDPALVYLGHCPSLTGDASPEKRIVRWLSTELAADAIIGMEAVLLRSDLPSSTMIAQGYAQGVTYNCGAAIVAGLLLRLRGGKDFSDLPLDVLKVGLLICLHEHGTCLDDDIPTLCASLEYCVIQTPKDREDFARLWIEPSLQAGSPDMSGLYKLARDERWRAVGTALASGWLNLFPNLPLNVELELVSCLTHEGDLLALRAVAAVRSTMSFRDDEHRLTWLAIDAMVRFESVFSCLQGISTQNPDFIWFLRNRFQIERHGAMLPLGIAQAKWIISEFRTQWPYAVLQGSGSGDTNPYDATDFLRAMINRIANDTSAEANEAMQELALQPADSYSDLIRHMAAEQRQKSAEENFTPLLPKGLGDLLNEGTPSNMDDIKALVLEELTDAQKVLIGDDLDQVRDFWNDAGIPHAENRCRDRLAVMISPQLIQYGIQRITEADMPQTKRADLAFAHGRLQLPMEVKGQWHPQVWQAATDQLDHKYLIDWRSEQRGIYCVLWFGDLPTASGRRLRAPAAGVPVPKSADEMREILIEGIPIARRAFISVVVLDFSTGR